MRILMSSRVLTVYIISPDLHYKCTVLESNISGTSELVQHPRSAHKQTESAYNTTLYPNLDVLLTIGVQRRILGGTGRYYKPAEAGKSNLDNKFPV